MRQDEILSPLLFAIYLNDFEYFVSRSYRGLNTFANDVRNNLSDDDIEVFLRLYVSLYADDTIIMAESATELKLPLDAVFNYSKSWYLSVNTSKTKIVNFARGKVRSFPEFTFGDSKLEVVSDYVYLGTMFNYNGRFEKAIEKQISQARRAMYAMSTKARKWQLPLDIQGELFDQLIVPIILHGSEVGAIKTPNTLKHFTQKI